MSSGAWLEIDLLRQRREQFGHQRPKSVPVRTLVLRGALMGSVLPLLLVLVCLWFWLTEMRLAQQAQRLQPLADEHDLVQAKIQTATKGLEALIQTNKAMAKAMADVRSSSAVLAELSRLVPKAISFNDVSVKGSVLELSGDALQPNGLRTVNALMLSLAASGLFQQDGVVLEQAQVQESAGSDQAMGSRLGYTLKAEFAADAPQAIRPQLAQLGALGLEQRLQRIQQEEGLLE